MLAKKVEQRFVVFEDQVGGWGMEAFGRFAVCRVEGGYRQLVIWRARCCEDLSCGVKWGGLRQFGFHVLNATAVEDWEFEVLTEVFVEIDHLWNVFKD